MSWARNRAAIPPAEKGVGKTIPTRGNSLRKGLEGCKSMVSRKPRQLFLEDSNQAGILLVLIGKRD